MSDGSIAGTPAQLAAMSLLESIAGEPDDHGHGHSHDHDDHGHGHTHGTAEVAGRALSPRTPRP